MVIERVESRWFGLRENIKILQPGDSETLVSRPTLTSFGGIIAAESYVVKVLSEDSVALDRFIGEEGSLAYMISQKLSEIEPGVYTKGEINTLLMSRLKESLPYSRKPWHPKVLIRWRLSK